MHQHRTAVGSLATRALPLIAALYATAFVACAAARLSFGFELSWMESGMQAMLDRLASHQSMYVEPSPAYVPFIYPPLYYVAAHWLGRALPSVSGVTSLRLLSLASTAATALVMFCCLGRRGRGLTQKTRLVLVGLFLAFYGRFEFWQDQSRVDSFFVFLLFSATALLIEGNGNANGPNANGPNANGPMKSAVGAGLVGGLAILSKQPGVILLGVCAAVVAATGAGGKRALVACVIAALAVVAGLAMLGELPNRWFYYYVLEVPAAHPFILGNLGWGVVFLLTTMPLFLLRAAWDLRPGAVTPAQTEEAAVPASGAAVRRQRRRCWALTFVLWTIVILLLRLKQGTSVNFFLPVVPVGLMVAGAFAEDGERRRWNACAPLLVLQFLLLLYNPLAAIPTAKDWAAGFELLAALRRIPGDVFLPEFPGYLAVAGKAPVAHDVAVCDLAELRPDLLAAIDAQLAAGHYAAAFPSPTERYLPARCRPPSLSRYFRPQEAIPEGGDFFGRSHRSKLTDISLYDGGALPPQSALVVVPRRQDRASP